CNREDRDFGTRIGGSGPGILSKTTMVRGDSWQFGHRGQDSGHAWTPNARAMRTCRRVAGIGIIRPDCAGLERRDRPGGERSSDERARSSRLNCGAGGSVSGTESNPSRPNLQPAGYKPRAGMADSAIDRSVAWTEKLPECKNYKQDL